MRNTTKKCIAILIILCVIMISIVILRVIFVHVLGMTEEQASTITGIGGVVAQVVAALMIVFQLDQERSVVEKQSDIEEANFILQYNQTFIQDENMSMVERLLEQHLTGEIQGEIITSENKQKFINYLVYLEGFAPLVLREVIRLETIDDLMAYRFFLAINNKELQEKEITVFAEYYRGCFKMYNKWKAYRNSIDRPILQEENSLDKWYNYEKYIDSPYHTRALTEQDNLEEVSEILYHTDPYIYPAAFGSAENMRKILPELMVEKGNIFSRENILITEKDGQILGALVYLTEKPIKKIDSVQLKNKHPELPDSITDVCDKYFAKLGDMVSENQAYIACVCVSQNYRRNKIGEMLIKNALYICGKKEVLLDVIADNEIAIDLYKKYGFQTCGEQEEGYAYGGEGPMCWAMKVIRSET